jgi:hypothetical protein
MLIATRDDRVRHDALPAAPQFGPAAPARSLSSRFTSSVQVVGSFVGIPLALLGGYATYTSNFSVEAKCQSLRGSIVSMLDKKADPSTLRLLMQRDVAIFQRDCGEVDPDAVAAFKNLLVAERAPAARAAKAETSASSLVKAEPAKVESAPKTDATAKAEAPKKPQPAPVVVKRETDKPVQDAKPVSKPEPKSANVAVAKPVEQPETKVVPPPVKQAEHPEPKPMEASLSRLDGEQADTVWIASVREALREAAARPPAAEPVAEAAAPMPPPVVLSPPPRLARDVTPRLDAPPRPPADIPNVMPKDERPIPPAPVPHADASGPAAAASN